jgi:sigma-B regulation protein RsbU (phosphoserine phosphatase)
MLDPSGVAEMSRQDLLWELAGVVAATVFLASGAAAIMLGLLRSRDRLLLWLGVFIILYGLRLMLEESLARTATGLARGHANVIDAVVSSCIVLPAILFFRELLGARWRRFTVPWSWLQVVLTPLGITIALRYPAYWDLFSRISNGVVIAGILFMVAVIFLPPRRSPPGKSQAADVAAAADPDPKSRHVLRYALLVFSGFVIASNLRIFPDGRNLEPIGFAVLIAGLGYTAAKLSSERERKLLDVEHELETARRIQKSILPRHLPNIPGLQLAARYEPMTAVAGDFYDFLPAADGRAVTILVADVSGHGVPAALIAAMLKVAFGAQAEHARDPARILTNLNAILAEQLDDQFVTAACAFLDLEAGRITYAGAGHPPALLVHSNGEISELGENGLMLGPFRQAVYGNVTAPFATGDKLVLYTDGIIEATVAGQQFGLDRLKDFARHPSGFSTFADRLIAAVTGPIREDDLTVVVAQAGLN